MTMSLEVSMLGHEVKQSMDLWVGQRQGQAIKNFLKTKYYNLKRQIKLIL